MGILKKIKSPIVYGIISAILSFIILVQLFGYEPGIIYIIGFPFLILLKLIFCDPIHDFGCAIFLGLLISVIYPILIGVIIYYISKKKIKK